MLTVQKKTTRNEQNFKRHSKTH